MKELIGQGSFANVYRGILHETEVAVKVIKSMALKDMQKSLQEETGIMITLRHPQVVLFIGACIKNPDIFIVTEYMANGSIRQLLDNVELIIEQEHVRKFSIDTCKGMAYLHSRKILHRDLKTHNLLVDMYWSVKVADFGLSRSVGETADATMTACGTPSWAAPEVLRRDHYTHKADVYSFGICLWEMITRKRPYGTLKPYQVVISVASEGLRPNLENELIPPYFVSMIKQCWDDNPDERFEFTKLRDDFEALILPECDKPYPTPKTNRSPRSPRLGNINSTNDSRSSHELYTRKKFI
jgi:serine/threonine-protein kinase CTR1